MKYSILIPCYKECFLKETISSILRQSYPDLELIIVNDASPYDIDSVVSQFKDSRLRYYKNEINCGAYNVIKNWNKCLDYATGDYVIMMGDDDKLDIECLAEYNKLITKHPNLNVYHGRVVIIDENSNFVRMHESRPEWENTLSLVWHRLAGRQQYIGDFLFKREWLIINKGFCYYPLAWGSDDMTVFRASMEKGIANTNTPVFYYRINPQSISMTSYTNIKLLCNDKYKDDVLNIMDKIKVQDDVDRMLQIMIQHDIYTRTWKKDIHLFALDFFSLGIIECLKVFVVNKHRYNLKWSYLIMAFIEYQKMKRKR